MILTYNTVNNFISCQHYIIPNALSTVFLLFCLASFSSFSPCASLLRVASSVQQSSALQQVRVLVVPICILPHLRIQNFFCFTYVFVLYFRTYVFSSWLARLLCSRTRYVVAFALPTLSNSRLIFRFGSVILRCNSVYCSLWPHNLYLSINRMKNQ